MPTVTEQIKVTVTGANPNTYTYSLPVDVTTGSGGPLSITLTGVNPGLDTITASMASHGYTSNPVEVAWQQTNGTVAVGPISITTYSCPNGFVGYPGLTGILGGPVIGNSLVLNQENENWPISGFNDTLVPWGASHPTPDGGGYKLNPMIVVEQTSSGAYASYLAIPGTGGSFTLDMTGSFVVSTPGTYTFFVAFVNSGNYGVYIGGGATVSSATNVIGPNPFPSVGPVSGFPLASQVSTNLGTYPPYSYIYVNFPAPGVYPFEAIYVQRTSIDPGGSSNGAFQIVYLAGTQPDNNTNVGYQSYPVSLISTPPNSNPGTAQLVLTPTGSVALQGTSDTLTLVVQNVIYTSFPYCPIFEGVKGSLYVSNGVSSVNPNYFIYPTYNGNSVSLTAAATQGVINLQGNNTSWQGRLSLAADPSNNWFDLNYGGQSFDSGVANTQLTVYADDVAWYNAANKSFDSYAPHYHGYNGAISFGLEVDYMVNPGLNSPPVTSSTTSFWSSSFPLGCTITLSKPFSPQQQGTLGDTGNSISSSITASGGVVITSTKPNINSSGFLTGWTLYLQTPLTTTNINFNIIVNISGTLTYLNGTNFTTKVLTYVNNYAIPCLVVGSQYQAPVSYSFSTTPASGNVAGTFQLSATVYTTDTGSVTLNFFRQPYLGGTSTILGAGILGTPYTGTVGGKTVYYKPFTLTVTIPTGLGDMLMVYIATDTLSTLFTTYYSSTEYSS